jgi:predicted Fe-S protein YdhL (DUF1289 family)
MELLASTCLSILMEQLGSHRTTVHEILYWGFLPKCEKNEVWLKSNKNNRQHFM